jgi:hypothetical protein
MIWVNQLRLSSAQTRVAQLTCRLSSDQSSLKKWLSLG